MQKWEELAVITEICKAAEKYSPGMNGKGFMKSCRSSDGSQRPRSKLTEHQTCNAASCGVFDPRGSRQMDMQACPLGSLLAGIEWMPQTLCFPDVRFQALSSSHMLLSIL